MLLPKANAPLALRYEKSISSPRSTEDIVGGSGVDIAEKTLSVYHGAIENFK
jgi:hypothetical protein